MAKKYVLDGKLRAANTLVGLLTRLGLGPGIYHILKTTGRKSGQPRETPVIVMEKDGQRWIVSPYGERPWVKNVRAEGEVSIRRGFRTESVRLEEVDAHTAAPILKEYIKNVPITRPYFDVAADSPDEDFVAEALRHPVFRVFTNSKA